MNIEKITTISNTILIECSIPYANNTKEVRKVISLSPGEVDDLIRRLQKEKKRALKNRETQRRELLAV